MGRFATGDGGVHFSINGFWQNDYVSGLNELTRTSQNKM